jgi:hypothetical protein
MMCCIESDDESAAICVAACSAMQVAHRPVAAASLLQDVEGELRTLAEQQVQFNAISVVVYQT